MPKKAQLWPWKPHERHYRPPKDYLIKGVLVGNAGDEKMGEDVPILIGERFSREGLNPLKGEIHAEYHKHLKKQTYYGEPYIVDTNYHRAGDFALLRLAAKPAIGAPDGRTRRLIRDLKYWEELRDESGLCKVIAQMKRYVQLHKLEYGCPPDRVIINYW
ncbi:MAG: hypothetical protein HZB51_28765 [Chloroflexi bacterium]|nr:hypothetical protein [Chloroflexota bacterium]